MHGMLQCFGPQLSLPTCCVFLADEGVCARARWPAGNCSSFGVWARWQDRIGAPNCRVNSFFKWYSYCMEPKLAASAAFGTILFVFLICP
jgi:hypothetical protein